MKTVKFEISNIVFTKPEGMTDDECRPLHAYRSNEKDPMHPFVLTAWEPSAEDLKAFKEGKPLWMKTAGHGFVPTAMFTMPEEAAEEVLFMQQDEFDGLSDFEQWQYIVNFQRKDLVTIKLDNDDTYLVLDGYEQDEQERKYLQPRDYIGNSYGVEMLLQAIGFKAEGV
jgi:hypothetical protein